MSHLYRDPDDDGRPYVGAQQLAYALTIDDTMNRRQARNRRRRLAWEAFWQVIGVLQWTLIGAALVCDLFLSNLIVDAAVAFTRPCASGSDVTCTIVAPDGTREVNVGIIGTHIMVTVHD